MKNDGFLLYSPLSILIHIHPHYILFYIYNFEVANYDHKCKAPENNFEKHKNIIYNYFLKIIH